MITTYTLRGQGLYLLLKCQDENRTKRVNMRQGAYLCTQVQLLTAYISYMRTYMRENLYMEIYWTRESGKCAVACVVRTSYFCKFMFRCVKVFLLFVILAVVIPFYVIKYTRMRTYTYFYHGRRRHFYCGYSIPQNPAKFPCAISNVRNK